MAEENSPSSRGVSRREIAAAALGSLIVPRHVLGGVGYQAPSDTIRIAGIGVGGMGRRYLQGCASERIEVLCDIDHSFAAPVFRKYPQARVYTDFRQMFDKEEKNIDAVIVATPDHNHAVVTMQALKRGKHVYCAKPLTHTVHEVRAIAAAARDAKVATQMSVQSCASDRCLKHRRDTVVRGDRSRTRSPCLDAASHLPGRPGQAGRYAASTVCVRLGHVDRPGAVSSV